jgi:hypothetical protein
MEGISVRKCLAVAVAALGVVLLAGDAGARGPVRVGGNVPIGFPVGEFGDNVDRVASGINGYVILGIRDWPVGVGGTFSFMTQGSEQIGRMQIGQYVGDMVTRNKLLTVHAIARVQDTQARLAPFVDVLVGLKRFYTTTEIKIGFNVPDIDMDSDSWVLSYGVGAGLAYEIYESAGDREDGTGGHRMCFDLGARYLLGAEADDIVDIDSVTIVDDRIAFNRLSSRTDMVILHFGVSFLF